MFNINKTPETNTSEIKENFSQLVGTAKENISEVAKDVKQSTNKLNGKLQEKGKETKQDALDLIDSLKALLANNTESESAGQIKEQVTNKVAEWKALIQHEVTNAVESSKAQTTRVIHEQPFTSLAVAVGAGILIGYLLGNKQSSK